MPPEKHAVLGASKAHQWLACPPSVRFEERFPAPESSEAAEEGRVAHKLAEHHLAKALEYKKLTTPASFRKDPLYRPAMEEHVEAYCDAVMEVVNGLRQKNVVPAVYLEQELDLSTIIPEGFGTADCIVIADGKIHVFDFKYGRGVPVEAEENPQLKLYALGVIQEFDCLYDISAAVLHIVQPRLGSITEWEVSREVLEKWGQYVVRPIAEKAFNGDGEFCAGEDQCRFCNAKNACRAYNNYMLDQAKERFNELGDERLPNELSPEEIAKLLGSVEAIKRWANSVAEYAQDQAINHGVHWPGYKLVEGMSRRKITEEEKVITILDDKGFTTDKICKLKGITDLEDLVGAKMLNDLIGDYIVKPPGKPTLVPESDKRQPIDSIKFTEVKE